MNINTEVRSGTEYLADLLKVKVEQLRLDFPKIDEIIMQPTGKHIQQITKKYGYKSGNVIDFLLQAKALDEDEVEVFEDKNSEPELKAAIGEDVSGYIEKYTTKFIKENLPEYWDKESEIIEKLTSTVPDVRKEAMRGLLMKFDISSSHSITRLSNTECPPIVLQRIVEECIDDFIQKRVKLNSDFSFPSYFYAALRNDSLPRYVLIDIIEKLTNSSWILESQRTLGYQLAKSVENLTTVIATIEKNENPIKKEIEEKVNSPKTIKRIKDTFSNEL